MAFSTIKFLLACLLGLCIVNVAEAHGWMSSPSPRGQFKNPKRQPYEEYAPTIGNDPSNVDFVCRSDPAMPASSWSTFTAGQSVSITLDFNAAHPGDCFVYLTYDGDKDYTQQKWFKIWEQHTCSSKTAYTVTIPSYLPDASHAIFRWEWYGLHRQNAGDIEFYTQCHDALIRGVSGGVLPTPQVNIPGHLPKEASAYWDPYNGAPMFFTGPQVATKDGSPYVPPTAGATTKPAATPKPTQPGTPTQPPTVPGTTPAPTVTPDTCNVGAKACSCTTGGSCDKGLTCVSKICVDLNEISSIKGSASSAVVCLSLFVLSLLMTLMF